MIATAYLRSAADYESRTVKSRLRALFVCDFSHAENQTLTSRFLAIANGKEVRHSSSSPKLLGFSRRTLGGLIKDAMTRKDCSRNAVHPPLGKQI